MKEKKLILAVLLFLLPAMAYAQTRAEEAVERNDLGVKLLGEGKVDEAIAEFRKAVKLDSDYATGRLNLGYAYDRQGRSEEAMGEYLRAIELGTKSPLAHNNLGVLYDKQGRYDEAIGQFEKALQTDPANAGARQNLENAKKNKAVVQEREKQIARALKEAQARPQSATASYNVARLYAFYDKKDLAFEWLAKALKLGFSNFDSLKSDPALKSLRDDPSFATLLKER